MEFRTARRVIVFAFVATFGMPVAAAPPPASRSWVVPALMILVAVALLAAIARVANAHARWKRVRYRHPTVALDPAPPPARPPSRFWRVVRYVLLLLVVAWLVRACARPGDDYPDGWPWIRPVALVRHGGCPDIEGDYTDVDADFPRLFGAASELDRWQDHHVRIEQSDDGRTIHLEFGLNATGMRAARGELPVKPHEGARYQGRARSVDLHEHAHYECTGGWIYSVAKHDSGGDDFRSVDARMTRDLRGGLVIGHTVEWQDSIGWGDSPHFSIGRSRETRWTRLPPRPPRDAARVRELQDLKLVATPYRNASAVVTVLVNHYDEPLCMRLERTVAYTRETQRETSPLGYDEWSTRGEKRTCPEGTGLVEPMRNVQVEMIPPDPGAKRVYVVRWARRDVRPMMWEAIRVEDVRDLPQTGERTLDD